MRNSTRWMSCGLALALAACGAEPAPAPAVSGDPAGGQPSAADDAAATATAADSEGVTPAVANTDAFGDAGPLLDASGNAVPIVPFDIDSVPLSSAPLGELPFFSLPTGYGTVNRPARRAFARFPFRLGEGVHWVEGASWNSLLGIDPESGGDKAFSPLELRRNLEAVLGQAGATQVFEGPLRRDIYYGPQIEAEIGGGFIEGVNLGADTPTTVHVIRQAQRNIWVQLSTHSHGAAMVVVEERPFVATARWQDAFPYLSPPSEIGRAHV